MPVVVAERLDGKFETNDQFMPDYIYAAKSIPATLENGPDYIVDADVWAEEKEKFEAAGKKCSYAFSHNQLYAVGACQAELKFLFIPFMAPDR